MHILRKAAKSLKLTGVVIWILMRLPKQGALLVLPDKAVLLLETDSTGCRPFSESSGYYKLSISIEWTGSAPQVKKLSIGRAAMIHVDTSPTLPSALGLSLG